MSALYKGIAIVSAVLFMFCGLVFAKTFSTPEKALERIFKGAKIEIKRFELSAEQAAKVEKLSGVKVKKKQVTFYIATKDEVLTGYAYVDTHIVRTRPQTVLYVLTQQGAIDRIEILSFYEPLEYLADESWLKTFKGKSLSKNAVRVKRDVVNVSGASLTSKAVTNNARKVLALWTVIFGEAQ